MGDRRLDVFELDAICRAMDTTLPDVWAQLEHPALATDVSTASFVTVSDAAAPPSPPFICHSCPLHTPGYLQYVEATLDHPAQVGVGADWRWSRCRASCRARSRPFGARRRRAAFHRSGRHARRLECRPLASDVPRHLPSVAASSAGVGSLAPCPCVAPRRRDAGFARGAAMRLHQRFALCPGVQTRVRLIAARNSRFQGAIRPFLCLNFFLASSSTRKTRSETQHCACSWAEIFRVCFHNEQMV